ncbi:MAG: hypothetical protein WC028_02795 [Candidatus Obscuribacterales bacterium]
MLSLLILLLLGMIPNGASCPLAINESAVVDSGEGQKIKGAAGSLRRPGRLCDPYRQPQQKLLS